MPYPIGRGHRDRLRSGAGILRKPGESQGIMESRAVRRATGGTDMILVIDNYDSFTYNLVQYLGELGEEIVVYRNDEIDLEGISKLAPNHILISPGPCTPNEAGVSLALLTRFAGEIPIFGVCLGH